jgi:hypothetical protein
VVPLPIILVINRFFYSSSFNQCNILLISSDL